MSDLNLSRSKEGVYTKCICGADQQIDLGQKNNYTVVSCSQCGMVYVNPQPNQSELISFYSKEYWGAHQEKLGLGSIEKRAQDPHEYKYFTDIFVWMKERVNIEQGMRLLEIGCSHGMFCEIASGASLDVVGVEMDKEIAASTAQRTGLKIFSGGISNQCFNSGEFDFVAMFDVLEHFTDPVQELRNITDVLKQNGWLYLSTPCRDEFSAQIDILAWGENKPPEHLFLFDYDTIENLLKRFGFYVWDAKGVYSNRMFILARKGVPPQNHYRKPVAWLMKAKFILRNIERKVRYAVRSLLAKCGLR